MQRGKITILIILFVAVAAASVSVWYHFLNQHLAQQFWGTETALLIDKAPKVQVVEFREAGRLSLGDPDEAADEPSAEGEAPEPAVKAIEFNETPWIIAKSQDAGAAKGIANLRRALVLDTSYDWDEPENPVEPKWQYGLAVEDGMNWATVLFDFDSRQVGLAGGRRTALLNAEANSEFKGFFAEQFAEDKQSEPKPADGAENGSAAADEEKPEVAPPGEAAQPAADDPS